MCSDNTCIAKERTCDGVADCIGAEDEYDCGKFAERLTALGQRTSALVVVNVCDTVEYSKQSAGNLILQVSVPLSV